MLRGALTKSWPVLAVGIVFGLALAGALAVGIFIGQHGSLATAGSSPAAGAFADLRLKASATHGADTFAIATGPVDDDVEGLYTLDFLTGDLQCFVVNGRTGTLGGWFKTNVASHLSIEKGKKPNYLLATGLINVPGGGGNQRPAASLVYVLDANTGEWAAYTFPWAKAMTAAGMSQAREMTPVFKGKARDLNLRQ